MQSKWKDGATLGGGSEGYVRRMMEDTVIGGKLKRSASAMIDLDSSEMRYQGPDRRMKTAQSPLPRDVSR